ncbi:MAG: hypothetical protein AAGG48_32315 [Planctomycetota bacterium]
MTKHILYAYVCGNRIDECAADLIEAFDDLIAKRSWVNDDVFCVDQVSDGTTDHQLGINISLPDPGEERYGWFSDIIAIAELLAQLSSCTRREFAIGIFDTQTQISEDLHYVRSSDPDIDRLRAIIGVGEIE